MKKFLLMIAMVQFFALSMWGQTSEEILFKYENGTQNMENQIPVKATVDSNKNLNIYTWSNTPLNVSVCNRNNTLVYSNQISGKARRASTIIPLEGYAEGEYTITVTDDQNNVVVGRFELEN